MSSRFSCARTATNRGESLIGTASTVRHWVAVEQPGPWGTDALADSRMEHPAARALDDLTDRLGARLVLIRRHGGGGGDRRRVLVADAGAEPPWLEELVVDEPGQLADLDLTGLTTGGSVGGRRLERPRYLVCTHGSHDPCCAEYGRPAAAVVDEVTGERGWESSHIGGDRFAGNLVVLPDGVYYGRLTEETAGAVVASHDTGRLLLDHYRGRVCWSFAVQAAEGLLRRRLEEVRIGAVRLVSTSAPAEGTRRAVFNVDDVGHVEVEVAVRQTDEPHRLTCHSQRRLRAPTYELVGLHRR